MKIVLYTNRNVGMLALSYLKGLGHNVIIITDGDKDIEWLAGKLKCHKIETYHLPYHDHDLFLCVHGRKIIPKELLSDKMINIHPTQYNGHNPVKTYIKNKDVIGSLRAMYMTENVDEGGLIVEEKFATGECKTYADYYNIALPYYIKILSKVIGKISI